MRNRLSELALAALGADFAEFGPAVIKEVRETEPKAYLQIVASLLPKQLHVERTSVLGELTDQEFELLGEHLAAVRARLVKQIGVNGAQKFPPASPASDNSE
jgi:hypothetical protein